MDRLVLLDNPIEVVAPIPVPALICRGVAR
jgi:hypothetical protein